MKNDNELRQYIRDCEILDRELRLIQEDRQAEQDGWELRYAVDFSEIKSYAILEKATKTTTIFWDEEDINNITALQQLMLRRFFFTTQKPIILLKPHEDELEDFFFAQSQKNLRMIVHAASRIYEEAHKLQETPEIQAIKQIGTDRLSQEEKVKLVGFLKNHAPNLCLLRFPETGPLQRVYELFEKGVFEKLSKLEGLEGLRIDVDDEVEHAWNISLIEKRKGLGKRRHPKDIFKLERASERDAIAMAMIARANLKLRENKIRILFITRSSLTHQILLEVKKDADYERYGGDFVRSLRGFTLHQRLKSDDNIALKEQINSISPIVKSFLGLTLYHTDASRKHENMPLMENIADELPKIREIWRQVYTLDILLGESETLDKNYQDDHMVEEILRLLKEDDQLNSLFIEEIRELVENLDKWHVRFGFGAAINRSIKRTQQAMPYKLSFYHLGIQQQISLFENSHEIPDILAILKRIGESFEEPPSEYERLLAYAFISGSLSYWEAAETFCRRALGIITNVPKHEGYFVLAVCARKWNRSIKRHLDAIKEVDTAIKIANNEKAHYLKEKAIHILMLHEYYPDFEQRNEKPFSPHYAMALLEQAKNMIVEFNPLTLQPEINNLTDMDRELLLQIYNNLIYYNINLELNADRNELIQYKNILIDLQEQITLERKHWPPYLLDTIGWSELKLSETLTHQQLKEIINHFRYALAKNAYNDELEKTERETIMEHLKEARERLRLVLHKNIEQ